MPKLLAPLTWLPLLLLACASGPPPRYVVERDLEGYGYRRYQKVLDVEFVIDGNPGVGHTAAYLRRRGGEVSSVSAFVTVYEKAKSLTAEVHDRIFDLSTYDVTVTEVEGEWVWELKSGSERWLLWVSANRVVKLGGTGTTAIPEELAEAYLDIYPSDLEDNGRAREDAPSAGTSSREAAEEEELRMPAHLRGDR